MKDLYMTTTLQPHHQRKAQRGVSLFIVIVIVLLSTLLALWSSRTALFNEMVVGNDADYQRAFEAAQALLQDAELDIREERADGQPCTKDLPSDSPDTVCRRGSTAKIPLEAQEVGPLLANLEKQDTKCLNGLCTKRIGRQDFWNYTEESKGITPVNGEVVLEELSKNETGARIGARYGQYTGAAIGSSSAPANPILQWDDKTKWDKGGWYWIEVMPYDESSKTSGLIVSDTPSADRKLLSLNLLPNVVYRITALAYGRKDNTMVVLQQTYAQQKRKD